MYNDPTYQQPYQQPPYPPFQAPPQKPPSLWRRFRLRSRRFQWGIGCGTLLGIFLLCGVCGTIANALPAPPQTASSPTATTASQVSQPTATTIATQASQPTNTPTTKPTQAAPTATPAKGDPAAAILGGTLNDFIARYGQLNSHSDPKNGQYYFALYGNDKNDLSIQFIYNKHTDGIIYGTQENKYWTYTQAKNACLVLLPSDATYQRKMTILDTQGNPMDEQLVYMVPSLVSLFPASAFNDENGNPTKPGTIGLILTHWTDTQYLECVVQIGLESK